MFTQGLAFAASAEEDDFLVAASAGLVEYVGDSSDFVSTGKA